MNKRILSILICLLLAFTLVFAVACGNKDDGSTDSNTDTGSSNTDTGSTNTDTGSTNTDTGSTDTNTDTPADTNTNTDTTPSKHTVVLVYGNGEADKTYDVDHGKALATVPVNLNRAGYTFGGWTLNGEAWDKTSPITESVTIIASWIPNVNLLVFDSNGGTGEMANQSIETDAKAALAANAFMKSGYEFAGWSTVKDGEVAYADGAEYTMGTVSPAVLYAVWTPIQYQISYDVQDGTNNADNPAYYTVDSVVTFKDPTREGWIFDGWEFMESPILSTEGCMGGLSLVATWVRPRYDITYSFSENVNGLEITNSNPVDINCDEVVELADAMVVGYKFVGWYTDAEFTNAIETLENVNAATALYGKFEKDAFSIEYVCPDGVVNSGDNIAEYDPDTDFTFVVPTVNKVGYKFDGWFIQGTNTELKAIVPNTLGQNLVLEARISPINYTITYSGLATPPSGYPTTFTVDDIESGKIALPSEITINGATFVGWYSDSEYQNAITEITVDPSAPADVTVYAKLDLVKYTITYVLGDKVKDVTVTNENPTEYDITQVVTFAPAVAEGFAFKGWYTDETLLLPLESTKDLYVNITLYAKWSSHVEKITMNQIESIVDTPASDGTANWGNKEQLFDGISEYEVPNNWHGVVTNGWAGSTGATLTITFDEEYYITTAQLYYWANWKHGQIIFYDANDNEVGRTGNEWNAVIAFSGTDGTPMNFEINNNVKKIVYTATNNTGLKTISLVEFVINVGEAPEVVPPSEQTPIE